MMYFLYILSFLIHFWAFWSIFEIFDFQLTYFSISNQTHTNQSLPLPATLTESLPIIFLINPSLS